MKQVIMICCGCLLLAFGSNAQMIDQSHLEGMNMRHLGPGTMSGRVTSIDVVRDNTAKILIGTASGGIWQSESGGVTWEPLFDDQDLTSIGAVTYDPQNESVLWVGTGEGNPRNSHSSGGGVFKSIDAGRTWQNMGLEKTMNIHRVIVDPRNSNQIYVAALGSIWGKNKERGVYKSTDGGDTWKHALSLGDKVGCAELVMDPNNSAKLFASMWEYGRKPWTFNSGGESSALMMTVDNGKTWNKLNGKNGLPEGPYGRIGIAIAPSNPKVVYALIESEKTGLYRSNDGGYSWQLQATKNIGNRPFYYAEIYVHPSNENRVYNLYSMVSKSEDAGKTFEVILPYSGVHPDHHAFYIHPDDPSLMLDGNDGGLNISRDGGENWQFVTNLPLGQFYHINIDMDVPYNIYGGMQDNGSWKGPGYVWHSNGIRNEDWQEISFGDGFDVVPIPGNPDEAYSMYQGGNVYKVHIPTGQMTYIQPMHQEGEELRFNWNGAIAQDPFNNEGIYFGSQYVHKSDDYGASWEIISPDLTTNDSLKQKQAESGGLTIDATRAENYTTITAIAPSPHNKDVIWVGSDDGQFHLTMDGGETWLKMHSRLKGIRSGFWIPQIQVGQKAGEAFVVVNDYRRNHWKAYLYHTYDYGRTWENLVADVPKMSHCHAVVQDPENPDLIFVGTERGLWFSLDKGVNWQKWTENYPSVPTTDLKIHPREGDLIIGTFGRGVYVLDDLTPLRKMAELGPKYNGADVLLFDAPDAYLAEYRRARGARFMADHVWEGDNKWSGAVFSAYFSEKALGDTIGEATAQILNAQGDSIQTWTFEPDTGLVRIRWDLRKQGVYWPSRKQREEGAKLPGNMKVNPGKYKMIITYKEDTAEAIVNVLSDPRLEWNEVLFARKRELMNELETTIKTADEVFVGIREGQRDLDLAIKNLDYLDDTLHQDLRSEVDSIKQVLVDMELHFMNAEDFKGYDHVTERLTSHLYNAESYISSMTNIDSQNAVYALENAKLETQHIEAIWIALRDGAWKGLLRKLEEQGALPKRD